MSTPLDPSTVAGLQRKYTGLDNNLNYLPGHTIHRKYDAYKAADSAAGTASRTYQTQADSLKLSKPYTTPPAGKPVGGGMYSKDGHRTLAPLAGSAASAAQVHHDSRNSFNTDYKDLLTAKGNYASHVQAATQAQSSQKKYAGYETKHTSYGK